MLSPEKMTPAFILYISLLYFQISPEIVQLYSLDNTARFKITRTLPVMYLDAKCRPLVITIITSSEIATKTSCNVQFNESLALNETQTVEFRQRVSSRPQIKEYHIEFLVHAAKCHADYSNMAKMQGLVPLLPKVKVRINHDFSYFL